MKGRDLRARQESQWPPDNRGITKPLAEEATVRRKRNLQDEFDFQPSNLKLTNDYFRRYAAIDRILRETPAVLDLAHRDLKKPLAAERKRDRKFDYTSETVLRMVIVQKIEAESQRGLVIRIDDSCFLRRFVGIHNGKMMNYTTYCKLKNAIRPETWKRITRALTESACGSTPPQSRPTSTTRRIPRFCGMSTGCWPARSAVPERSIRKPSATVVCRTGRPNVT